MIAEHCDPWGLHLQRRREDQEGVEEVVPCHLEAAAEEGEAPFHSEEVEEVEEALMAVHQRFRQLEEVVVVAAAGERPQKDCFLEQEE